MAMTSSNPTRSSRIGAILACSALAVSAVAVDLALPALEGLTLPLYAGAVLVTAVFAGGGPALAMAVGCTVVFVWVHGAQTGDAALIGSTMLMLGAALVGRRIDRLRRRLARLERALTAARRSTENRSDTAPDPLETVEEPGPVERDPAPRPVDRPSTGNLPRLLYRYARLLNVHEEDAIYTGLALTLEEVLPAERVAVYAISDGTSRLAAGDALPAPPVEVATGGATSIFTRDDDPDTVYGRVRAGADGPVTAVIVVRKPGGARRPGALKLLATFVQWASASVGHARARVLLDAGEQAESTRRAEARGRATARAFAETGSIPLLPPEGPPGRPRAPRPERAPIFGEERPPPRIESTDEDDTERIAPQAIAGAFAGEFAERKVRLSDSLPFSPPRVSLPSRPTAIEPPGAPLRPAPLAGQPTVDETPDPDPMAEHIDGDVRAAIERMARRLANAPSLIPESVDGIPVPPMAAFEGLGHGQIDDDMVSAEELPLIGGPGLGVAAEVGRSPVKDRFAHLLADLSDHLDGEGDAGR